MKKNKWDKKKVIKILDIAIVFCVVGCITSYGVIVVKNHYIKLIFKQLMHIGTIIVAICAINYNKIK